MAKPFRGAGEATRSSAGPSFPAFGRPGSVGIEAQLPYSRTAEFVTTPKGRWVATALSLDRKALKKGKIVESKSV
jgi:hypothetical protein